MRKIAIPLIVLTVSTGVTGGSAQTPALRSPTVTAQVSGTDALLQAVSVVDSLTVWISGHRSTYVRTTDGGRTWHAAVVPGPDSLQFRDVHSVNSQTAYLLAAGPGDMSRIYRTDDGGVRWRLQFQSVRPEAFFDCFDFWDVNNGVAFSDAVDGKVIIIRTGNGGATWDPVDPELLPSAAGSEGAFAASGTCLVVTGDQSGWIGTGAGDAARVYRTADRGRTWDVVTTPLVGGTGSTGIASLSVLGPNVGVALGATSEHRMVVPTTSPLRGTVVCPGASADVRRSPVRCTDRHRSPVFPPPPSQSGQAVWITRSTSAPPGRRSTMGTTGRWVLPARTRAGRSARGGQWCVFDLAGRRRVKTCPIIRPAGERAGSLRILRLQR